MSEEKLMGRRMVPMCCVVRAASTVLIYLIVCALAAHSTRRIPPLRLSVSFVGSCHPCHFCLPTAFWLSKNERCPDTQQCNSLGCSSSGTSSYSNTSSSNSRKVIWNVGLVQQGSIPIARRRGNIPSQIRAHGMCTAAAATGSCDAAVFSGGCGGVVSSISCTHRMDQLLAEDFPSEEFEELESPNPRR